MKTNATFYELTKRLEELGYIAGYYTARIVGDFAVRERYYEITVAGVRAYHAAHTFYTNGAAAPIGNGKAARRSRRRSWRRKHRSRLRAHKKRAAEHAGTSRSERS